MTPYVEENHAIHGMVFILRRQKPMHLFSEAALLKMETTWTNHRKDWGAFPSLVLTWLDPTLLLKPNEIYTRKSYLRTAFVQVSALTFAICVMFAVILIASLLFVPHFRSVIIDPRNHKLQIGILLQEGSYYLPFVPMIWLLASLAINWPRYFF